MPRPRRADLFLTPEEYLAFEETARVRHEYVAGRVYAMSGGSLRHARIIGNVYRRLHDATRGGPCTAYTQDVKVRADEQLFYYPDVVVGCAAQDEEDVVLTAPCLVVEVLSPSTRVVDVREKLSAYRRIGSLRAYLIVETRYRRVERHWPDVRGGWRSEVVTPSAGGGVEVPCPQAVLTLDEVYEGVVYRPRPRRLKERTPDYRRATAGA